VWEAPSSQNRIPSADEEALKYFVDELWEFYQFFHPNSFAAMYQAASHAQFDDKVYFSTIFDALSALGALYMENEHCSRRYYESARGNLYLQGHTHIEGFITRTILVIAYDSKKHRLTTVYRL
jgi:hypothetical protein